MVAEYKCSVDTVISLQQTFQDWHAAFLVQSLLRGIVQDPVEFKIPILQLIVDVSPFLVFGNVEMNVLAV